MIKYKNNTASEEAILNHLVLCKNNFIPSLDKRVDIVKYSSKIYTKAETFEAWDNNMLVGLIAMYINSEAHCSFVTSVSVVKNYMGKSIASNLLDRCIKTVLANRISEIRLEVHSENSNAISLYNKFGFITLNSDREFSIMLLDLNKTNYESKKL